MTLIIIVEDNSERNRAIEEMTHRVFPQADIRTFISASLGSSAFEISEKIEEMGEVVEGSQTEYDLVIIGTPPERSLELLHLLSMTRADGHFILTHQELVSFDEACIAIGDEEILEHLIRCRAALSDTSR